MSSIAIITARGGSKRIPRKNIKAFLGKPIIAYSIQAALGSKLFDEVMVSTDDSEIAQISMNLGAKVPFYRSQETSDDYATTMDVLEEVLAEYRNIGKTFEWMCCIYPTAPFVTADKLVSCMQELRESSADMLIPVVKFSYPPQRAFVCNEKNDLKYKWPKNKRTRSQDLEPLYHDVGQFYLYRLNRQHKIKDQRAMPHIVTEMEVQDIDNLEDWKLAELKYKCLHSMAYRHSE